MILKKILLLLLLSFCTQAFAAVENFTSYTEVDVPADRVTVTATKCETIDIDRDEEVYVYKDMTADYFGATWDHDWEVTATNPSKDYDLAGGYGVSNDVDDLNGWTQGLGHIVGRHADDDLYIQIIDKDDDSTDNAQGLSWSTKYYITTERTSETAVETRVYDDSGRTSLVDTISTAIPSGRRYQYVYGMAGHNSSANYAFSFDIENLDLLGGATTRRFILM